MPRLLNAVINAVFATVFDDQTFSVTALNEFYSRAAPGCSLRSLLVHIAITVYGWEDVTSKGDLIPKDFLLEVFEAVRGKTIRLGGPILFPVDVCCNSTAACLCNWHVHVEPAFYAYTDAEGEELGGEDSYLADCESEQLDYDGTDKLPAHESTVGDDEPEDVKASEYWHSALTMRLH